MKKYIFFAVLIAALQSLSAGAQVYEKKTIQAGQNLSDYAYYLFPSFSDGIVKLKNGGQLVSKLNFNLLICQMQFIDPHGDTLSIAKPDEIDSIRLNNSLFFYKDSYFEISAGSDSIKLVISRIVTYEPVKIGAMGLRSNGTGIQNYATLIDNTGTLRKLILNEDVDIAKKTTYFLLQKNGEMVNATKSNFLKLFIENKQSIEGYLKLNKTNFSKESDLKRLFNFCVKQPPLSSSSK